jgi:hypothetical protein
MKRVIATRVLDVLDLRGQPGDTVTISFGRPVQEQEGEWSCAYRVVGLGFKRSRQVFGLDAVQALQAAFLVVGGMLAGTTEAREGRLRWAGSADLGFPLPPEPRKPAPSTPG